MKQGAVRSVDAGTAGEIDADGSVAFVEQVSASQTGVGALAASDGALASAILMMIQLRGQNFAEIWDSGRRFENSHQMNVRARQCTCDTRCCIHLSGAGHRETGREWTGRPEHNVIENTRFQKRFNE